MPQGWLWESNDLEMKIMITEASVRLLGSDPRFKFYCHYLEVALFLQKDTRGSSQIKQ